MSLPALALLMTATGALREVAPDWLRVEMAPREPLELAQTDGRVVVAVYTGDETQKVKVRRWFDSNRTIELAVQVILPAQVVASFEGKSIALEIHKAGADVVFATVHRLMEMAFSASAPGSWGELWQGLVTHFDGDLEKRPFVAETPNKVDLAAIDFSLPCQTIASPALGQDSGWFWPALVAKMRGDAKVAAAADYVEALIAGRPLSLARAQLALAGLSLAEGQALGLAPFDGLEVDPVTAALQIVADGETIRVTADDPEAAYGG